MPSYYIDETDPNSPPHSAGSLGGRIDEISDPGRWCTEQHALAAWHHRHAVDGLLPPDTPIDGLVRYLGHVHKVEVGRDGTDFRYRIYGSLIAGEANMRMQGRWVSELTEPTRTVILAHYQNLLREPRLFVGVLRYYGGTVHYPDWYRADSPVGTAEAGMTGVIVLTLPAELATAATADPKTS